MRTWDLSRTMREIRKAVILENGESLTDGQLLETFLVRGEEAAFETLVHRHGQMVLGVCRRVLRNTHDAEDAFQATFLVLVRKARSIMPREMVGPWLYGVAYRTALEARTNVHKRHVKEKELRQMTEPNEKDENTWSELHSLLDRELTGLPKKYRVAIVLCDLEGKTRKEAAGLLHLPEGTLSTRLARGRALLAKRMTRRGIALSGGSLTMALGQNAIASLQCSLVHTTVKAGSLLVAGQTVTGIISPAVVALMEGVMKTMLLTKLKFASAAVLAIGLIGTVNLVVCRSLASAAGQVTATAAQDQHLEERERGFQREPDKPAGEGSNDAKSADLPQSTLPYWLTAIIDNQGKCRVGVPNVIYRTKYTKIKKDGEEKEAYYYEPHVKKFVQDFEGSEVKAFDARGNPIDSKDLQKLLAKETVVLASTDGRKVHPSYLRVLKEDALVLVLSKKLHSPYSPPGPEPLLQPPGPSEDFKSSGPPKGPAPYWVRTSMDKEGRFVVGVPVVTYKSGTAKVTENGEEKEVYYFEPVATENVKQFDSGDVKVFTANGKPLDSKEVQNILGDRKTLVLASTDGRKVDPFYLRIIKEGTLVLVISKPLFDPAANYQTPPP
jgi:RNA polymerase sigma factor (sigma-70 family)